MALTKGEQDLKKLAGFVGALQGCAWKVMSILCIILYCQPLKTSIPTTYMGQINFLMYGFFLAREYKPFPAQTVTPKVFFGFMWVYAILDLVWLMVSLNLWKTRDKPEREASALKSWAYLTFTICLLDVLMVVMLGADYQRCIETQDEDTVKLEHLCASGILPVLVIAAKGFVLWVVDLVLAGAMVRMGRKLKERSCKETQ